MRWNLTLDGMNFANITAIVNLGLNGVRWRWFTSVTPKFVAGPREVIDLIFWKVSFQSPLIPTEKKVASSQYMPCVPIPNRAIDEGNLTFVPVTMISSW